MTELVAKTDDRISVPRTTHSTESLALTDCHLTSPIQTNQVQPLLLKWFSVISISAII